MSDLIELRHRFAISKPKLFTLLSTPSYMEQWFSPDESIVVKVVKHEFKKNGLYHLQYSQPDGSQQNVQGQFLQIDAPHTICFSWQWLAPDSHSDFDTLVTWSLSQQDDSTELLVVHERLPDIDYLQRHRAGWLATINRLQAAVVKYQTA